MKIFSKQQAGETIVEVLISILVISVALAGAFAISNRSQKTVQANQERYQAQILANSQADLLKVYLTNDGSRSAINNLKPTFCMNGIRVATDFDAECKGQGSESLYNIAIQCQTGCSGADSYSTYKIKVFWDSLINNGGQDNVELWYGV